MLGKLFSFWRGEEDAGPLALYHAGDTEEAERAARERLATAADDRAALLTQAFLLAERGRGKEAIAIAERVLAANARDAQAWLAIARAHATAGRRRPAQEALQAAAQRDGSDPIILAELALSALADRQLEAAAAHLAKARGSSQRLALAQRQFAALLLERGELQEAERHLEQAIAADPRDALAHANLGAVRKDLGRRDEAARCFEQALALVPQLPEAAYNLAMLRIDAKDWSGAATLLRGYVAQRPREAEAQYWLGNALMGQGDAQAARAAYSAAVRIDAQHARARWGLAMAQLPAIPASVEEQQQGVSAFEQEMRKLRAWSRTAKGDVWLAVGAQQPFFLAYVDDNHAPVLREYGALCADLQAAWARKVKVPAPVAARAGTKLRVGIVSGHIQRHSVWDALLRGWVEHLDRGRFELHLFHTGTQRDAETRWAQGQVHRLVQGLGDWTAWAKEVSDTQCDVLVYPELGMNATALRLAALRLARVQLASWGHPLTSGLPTIDGYLSAEAFEPPDAQQHYTEKLHALPRLGCAYRPYGTRPQVPDLSAWNIAATDRLLLAPGVAHKYSPREDALWAEIARRCAPCKLIFLSADDAHTQRLQERMQAAFARAGVDFAASVRFIPWQSQAMFFGLLRWADVVLDTVGFSGFNTAMQAVECGTPIVAFEGRFMRGRFASGILQAMQMPEWIARTHEEYVEKVARLWGDAALREQVRAQIAARRGALYDDKGSIEALAALLEKLAG